jgi:drug/metabolite transporter (DMT)-like permease
MTPLRANLGLHLVALIWGASGVLGALISASPSIVTSGRSFFAALAIILFFRKRLFTELKQISRPNILSLLLTGVLLGIHWICFFKSIQAGGVAMGLVTYATAPTIIALLEVIFLKAEQSYSILLAALLSVAGVWMLHPVTNISALLDEGFVFGMGSALSVGVNWILVKRLLNKEVGFVPLSVLQIGGACLATLPMALMSDLAEVSKADLIYIFILGLVCSAIGQTICIKCLKYVRASKASIITSMEAPYGVILAVLFAGQTLTLKVITGVILVTLATVIVSIKPKAKSHAT